MRKMFTPVCVYCVYRDSISGIVFTTECLTIGRVDFFRILFAIYEKIRKISPKLRRPAVKQPLGVLAAAAAPPAAQPVRHHRLAAPQVGGGLWASAGPVGIGPRGWFLGELVDVEARARPPSSKSTSWRRASAGRGRPRPPRLRPLRAAGMAGRSGSSGGAVAVRKRRRRCQGEKSSTRRGNGA